MYNAETLELVNTMPFDSLKLVAEYLEIKYITIKKHLDTKIFISKKYIYLVKN